MHVPTSNSFFSYKTEAINMNLICKFKRISLAFQWDQNRYNRSYEQGVMTCFVGAVHGVRKWRYELLSPFAHKLYLSLSFINLACITLPPNMPLCSHATRNKCPLCPLTKL